MIVNIPPTMECSGAYLSSKGTYRREVLDFESDEGLKLEVNNGIFMKNGKFPE